MDGPGPEETLGIWREARAWWSGEPYVQLRSFLDTKGIRRIEERRSATLGQLPDPIQPVAPLIEDHREDVALQSHPRRDHVAPIGPKPPTDPIASQLSKTAWSVSVRGGGQGVSTHHVPSVANMDRWGSPIRFSGTEDSAYAPLHILSGYAFGRSIMLAEEAAAYAAAAGCPAAAIADPHSLVGALEFARACRRNGIKPLIGASVELAEGGEVVLLATSKRGYVTLSRLISECHLGEPRGFPLANWERLAQYSADLICLTGGDVGPLDRLIVRSEFDAASRLLDRLVGIYGRENVYVEIERSYLPWGQSVERRLLELADRLGLCAVAGGVLTHARRGHFIAQDVLLCAESLCRIDEVIGRKPRRDVNQPPIVRYPERSLNAERFIRTVPDMCALYHDRPDLLRNTLRLAEKCDDDVLPARTRLPSLFPDDNHALAEIVEAQAFSVYGSRYGKRHRKRLAMEVERIQNLGFASHFLVAWDFCRWATEQGIGLSGRGSAVDSAVSYVLGISRVDAIAHRLHFDRFLPLDGSKRPDLDIDFEAKRRDDIRNYLVEKYGKDRVGAVCAIGTYGTRGIVREVGKVFGLPPETISFLAKRIHGGISPDKLESALEGRPELRGSNIPRERFRWAFHLAGRLMDVPRNIRTHSSGVVITDSPLQETVPVMWSASDGAEEAHLRMIQWDKRSAKHVFDKFDILCLRGQDVLGGVEARLRTSDPDFSAQRLEATEDPEVYRAMRSGELIGIPQSASPAMRQAHQRLRTNNLHDASLVQAGIRPGVGGAVKLNELIARRRGKPYTFEHPDLELVLGHTYGIIVFQEQVDQLLQIFCGYSSGQAEDIRDAIYKKRREDFAETVRRQIVERAVSAGYPEAVAEKVYELVGQFRGYGFAQGHALAFSEISLRCVWMMQNKPAEYFAALLSAQPAGYYGPCTIANEARSRGVSMLPLDVNRSLARFEVEDALDPITRLRIPNAGIRVGLMQLGGLTQATKDRMIEHHALSGQSQDPRVLLAQTSIPFNGKSKVATLDQTSSMHGGQPPRLLPFGSIFDFAVKVRPSRDELEALILAGGFDSLHPNRRALLWAVPTVMDFAKCHSPEIGHPCLPLEMEEPKLHSDIPDFLPEEKAIQVRATLGLDVDRHLMGFERERVQAKGGLCTSEVRRLPAGTSAIAVGNPIRLRFPPTQSGKRVVFFDLEDETGLLNVTCFDDVYQRDGHAIVTSQYVTIRGVVQDRDGHTAFLASRVFPYRPVLLSGRSDPLPIGSGDFLVG